MSRYEIAKRFYSRAVFIIGELIHHRMTEEEFSGAWQRLGDKVKHEAKEN